MSDTAIAVERVAKRYRIPHPHAPRVTDYFRRPRWARHQPRSLDVMALDGVSFSVREGEVFGIIGRNGAGKSTLLKILSRITTPTSGRAEIAGRVASLLEVGTGFHPDLTGRENVYLNGMLLGMSGRAIDTVFDQICDFAGIGAYIESPIKRYSSGMQLRLAFAVAAHLAADTMIVDEVLAVGDAEFQAKCTTAMRDAAGRGRTTLFVSHNMAAVENLCSRVLWLERGRVVRLGTPDEVVREYLTHASAAQADSGQYQRSRRDGSLPVYIESASIQSTRGDTIAQGDDLTVAIRLDVRAPVRGLGLTVALSTIEGTLLTTQSNRDYRQEWNFAPGQYEAEVKFADVRLLPRPHTITLRTSLAFGADVCEHLQDVLTFHVQERDVLGSGMPLLADRGLTWFPAEFGHRQVS